MAALEDGRPKESMADLIQESCHRLGPEYRATWPRRDSGQRGQAPDLSCPSLDTASVFAAGVDPLRLLSTEVDREPSIVGPLGHQEPLLASLYVFLSSVTASLMSLDIIKCRDWGFQWAVVCLAATGFGSLISGAALAIGRIPVLRQRDRWDWMLLRGLMGGTTTTLAFFAVAAIELPVSQTIMFTMPLWAGVFARIILGQAWTQIDVPLALGCLAGVVLDSQMWLGFRSSGEGGRRNGGLAAALGFAIVNAAAALVVNTKLLKESALAITFVSMVFGAVLSCIIVTCGGHWRELMVGLSDDDQALQQGALLFVAVCMVSQQALRHYGLRLSRDARVTILLLSEIPLAFMWQVLVLQSFPGLIHWAAGASVVLGSVTATLLMKVRSASQHQNQNPPADEGRHLSHDGSQASFGGGGSGFGGGLASPLISKLSNDPPAENSSEI